MNTSEQVVQAMRALARTLDEARDLADRGTVGEDIDALMQLARQHLAKIEQGLRCLRPNRHFDLIGAAPAFRIRLQSLETLVHSLSQPESGPRMSAEPANHLSDLPSAPRATPNQLHRLPRRLRE